MLFSICFFILAPLGITLPSIDSASCFQWFWIRFGFQFYICLYLFRSHTHLAKPSNLMPLTMNLHVFTHQENMIIDNYQDLLRYLFWHWFLIHRTLAGWLNSYFSPDQSKSASRMGKRRLHIKNNWRRCFIILGACTFRHFASWKVRKRKHERRQNQTETHT